MPTKKISVALDKTTFAQIFFVWIGLLFLFGVVYALEDTILAGKDSISLGEGLYFSFITASTIGYGDFIPVGLGRLYVVVETILALTIYGVFISKLVSLKQETILEHVYDISFEERITRLRSMLYLFRSDLNSLIEKCNDGKLRQQQLQESSVYFHSLHNTMSDIDQLLHNNQGGSHYVKKIDFITFELLLNSIIVSLDKMCDFFDTLRKHKLKMKKPLLSIPLSGIYAINMRILIKYKQIDNSKISNKLLILDTINNRIKTEIKES